MLLSGRVRRGVVRSIRSACVAGIAVLAVASTVTGFRLAPAPARAGAPAVHGARPVHGVAKVPYKAAKLTVPVQTGRKFTATAVKWPSAASGTIALSAPAGVRSVVPPKVAPAASSRASAWSAALSGTASAGAAAAASGTPAWAQAVAPAHGTYSGPSRVKVAVQPQSAAARLGIHGVVWTVSGLGAGAGGVRAGLDYGGFAQAYGGNYGLRLGVEELPSCALTTPQVAHCRIGRPLVSVNDTQRQSVSALLPLSSTAVRTSGSSGARASAAASLQPVAAQPAAAVVLAAMSSTAGGEGGAAGTYGATSLKPTGTWSEGGSSGSFTYSYPLQVPSASSPLAPSVALSYDSGSVDGQTAGTQAQADWAGDGWSTNDSYVEQSFIPCADNPEGTTLPSAEQTEDMCYDGNNLTLSLNGMTTALVRDDSSGKWRLQDDDGAVVSKVTGSGNGTGTNDTSYWKITERDGISYYFGLNQLPGWASGDTATNSVDSEPVYSANSGDPCYSSAGFSSSVCTMAYRWHLDYVTDVHGDAMAYYYGQDTNYYGQDNGTTGVSYVRDSYLKEIDYGFRDGQAYTAGDVPDKVVYGTSSRCVASSCPAISSSNSGTAGSDYPDVPYDLNCASGASCSIHGPTYWSTVRLTSITTEQYSVASSAWQDVDTYTLDQTEPATGDGTSPTLWLASITRQGDDTTAGGSSSSQGLPSVSFGGLDLQDRVDTTNFPGLYRYRIDQITSEMGALTQVTYGTPDTCSASYVDGMTTNAEAASNTDSCFPVWWTPDGYTAPVMDWFEKYAVTGVTTSDPTGGARTEYTSYQYPNPGGAAWHYDDNPVVKAKYRTYGQFRGYGTVTTRTGDGNNDPQTKSVTAYYRGMSDDNNSTAVTLTDSQGGTHDDADQLAGQPLETTTYNGDGGPVDHSTITSYWVSPATATESRNGLPALTANMVESAETFTRQALTDGGSTTWRYTETDTTHDATPGDANFGLATYAYKHTVPVNSAYDECTSTTYAPANTSENLVGLVASAETDSVACSGFTEGSTASVPDGLNTLGAPSSVSRPDQVMSAAENFYDDTSFSTTFPQTAAPTTGDVTMTRKASGYSSGAFTWQTTARDTYDQYGRVEDAYDGNGNKTVTGYTVNSAGLTTGQTVTNPLGQGKTETLDPTRGLTLTSTDANGVVTTEQYDALGRLTGVWLDSRPTSDEANYTYAYTVSDSGVSGVVAETLGDAGGYATTVTILDSLGRTRQTQSDTPQGGRLVTDDFYDSRGWLSQKNNKWWDSANTPALSLVVPTTANGELGEDSQVPDYDVYTYNGLGQVIQDASDEYGNTNSVTTTVYNGDRTTVIPPKGGAIKSTVTDPLGRTSEIDEYTAAPTLNTPSNTFTGIWYVTGGTSTATTYGYDGHGNQASVTEGGQTWTSVYNLLGQATSKSDPDAGSTTGMTYDGNGNLLQETNADGNTVSYTYDALSRKTAQYAAATSAQSSSNETASWVYDNSNNVSGVTDPIGQLTTETSYSGGNAYTIQQTGFNVHGESLGETVTIPATSQDTGLSGSYTFSHTYTTGNNGLLKADVYPAAGGLPAETVGHTYLASPLDLAKGLAGIAGYAQTTAYDAYGDVAQEEIGAGTNLAYITSTYDPHTLRLTDQLVSRSVDPTAGYVDEEKYTYDLAGNPTSQTSIRLGSTTSTETQCFQYNALDQLSAAWTATDNCAATPSSSSHSTVGDGLGSASEYWTTWSYGVLGQMQSQDQHSVTGGTDTTTTDTYGGSSGGPDALTGAAASGGSSSSSSFGYDAAGNMTSRDTPADGSQTMTWTADGKLASVTSSKGATDYVYDADGNLLLQEDPGSVTLYLPGEQLTATTANETTTVTGARIIPLPSGGDVVRTGGTTSYSFEIPDQQGTNDLYLDDTAQAPTWRQFTPYGAPRGQTVTWVDNRGFLNKPADPETGLTYVGARAYDPATGQFISPDPVLNPSDPQDLDPYDYAEDNPVTNSDPAGMMCMGGEGPNEGCHPSQVNPPGGGSGSSGGSGDSGGSSSGGGYSSSSSGGGYTGSSPAPGAEFMQQLVLDHLLLLYQQWLAQQRAIEVAEHQLRQDEASCLWGSVYAHQTGCGTLGDAAALTSAEAGQCIGSAAEGCGVQVLEQAGLLMVPWGSVGKLIGVGSKGGGFANLARILLGGGKTAAEDVPALGDTSNLLPGYKTFSAAKRELGSPGVGNVFDHTVEQSQIGRSGFAPEEIHSPYNLNPVPAGLNQLKANYYSSIRPFTGGGTVRDWLTGQSFADQYEFGMDMMMMMRNGTPLP
jgi:RHS repeat-associated protein